MKKGKIKISLNEWKGKVWFVLNMLFSILYLVWRIFFTIPFGYGVVSVAAGIALLVVEMLGMVEAFIHYANMYSVKGYPLPQVSEELFPHVDVFIATYSEECALLYKTINGCKYMEYPDKNKVHIYLCDDNRRPEMRALAERMGVNYLDRPDNKGAKAGNLNNALAHSASPYVATFDADMIPKSDFLMKTIPYFVDCELKNKGRKEEDRIKLGFLQSPQCFYNPDLFQFNLFSEGRIPNEQDYFYRDIQVARTKTNSVIYGGSNTVLAREALEEIGGFYTEAITEDFATGILIQKKGYVTLGTGEPLASGMSATDLQGLIQQRVRWARGVIATRRKMHIFTAKDLSFAQKMNYWASIWYWYAPFKRIIYMLSPILYATFGFMVFKCTLPQVLLFWLPMYISSNISLRMLSNNIRSTKWTGVYETVLFPFMLLPVLLETFGITLKKFKVTEKKGQQNQKGKNMVYMIPFLILILLSAVRLVNCVRIMFDSGSFGPVVVLFWLVNNLYLMIMSLFFVDGRVPYRKAERVAVRMKGEINQGVLKLEGVTRDISETGISVLLEKPYYLEAESEADVTLRSDRYLAHLKTQIVFVSRQGEQWNYSMKILDYTDSYNEYLQMLYDRIPVLPQEIKKDSGSFEDLKLNTKKRVTAPFYQKRQYPRILLAVMVGYSLPEQSGDIQGDGQETGRTGGQRDGLEPGKTENRQNIQRDGQKVEEREVHKVGQKVSQETGKRSKEALAGMVSLYDFNYRYVSIDSSLTAEHMILHIMEGIRLDCVYEAKLRSGYKLYRVENCDALVADAGKADRLAEWLAVTGQETVNRLDQSAGKQETARKAEINKKDFDEMDLI